MQEAFDKYFPVVMGDKESPYLVLFDALIGYGKSYVARRLADIDGSIIICNNQVRYRLNDYDDQHAQEWHELQHQRIKALLANGNSLIIDECLRLITKRSWIFMVIWVFRWLLCAWIATKMSGRKG